ncbi:MAG TPA: hypothetical protein VJY35_05575 [Candidatus Eisenbacteria bacterium]|nr:hypothetical protein [Candidatus Eisenbacteria bacterium]
MELEALKAQWDACDRRLTESLHLNARLLRATLEARSRAPLRWLGAGIVVELVLSALLVVALGGFVADHIREPRFVLPALVLDLAMIAMLGVCIHQLVALARIDFGTPVVALQRELERLRVLRIRVTQWTFVLAPLLWTPMLIVLLRAVRVDAYAVLPAAWLAGNLAVGIAAIPVLLWVARRMAARFQGAPWLQGLMDDIAGRSLIEARSFLGQLADLERGEEPRGAVP